VVDVCRAEFVLGEGLCRRVREGGAHGAEGVPPKPLGVDVRVVCENVALDLRQDPFAPYDLEGVQGCEGQQQVSQRRRVEHTRIEDDPPRE
jgi:hypothetical protein